MIEYTITARQGNTTVDAEESREYGHARRVFEARCEQWEDAGERTRLTLADSDGHVISARTVN